MRVELLVTLDCPHVQQSAAAVRSALLELGYEPELDLVYVNDLDQAAGLGFHGSPTLRLDGLDVVQPRVDEPIGLGCRQYEHPHGSLDPVIPASIIVSEVARRREAALREKAAQPQLRDVPARTSRAFFLWASRRRMLGRFATAFPLTRAMVRRFVAGDSLDDALDALESLRAQGMRWTVDVLGESVASREMAVAAADRYITTLDALAERGLEANVSLKPTQMGLDIDAAFCLENIGRIVTRARELGAFVRVDMEDHSKTETTLEIGRALHEQWHDVGVVIQSYLRRSSDDIDRLIADGVRVRLCKGAYDEPASVAFSSREEVDESYRVLMERLLLHGRYPALATHDEALIEHAIAFADEQGIGPERYEFQMLYGVRRDLHERLVARGFTVRVYVPYGTQWYPYYMRRLAERPQNVIFMLISVLREGRGSGR